ncbi:MAG: DUF3267 domain-containing protein [Treponema sp.]|jgi:hypothetical protein|nr:DUF3267 domain-containing protein [Treponema sp.]
MENEFVEDEYIKEEVIVNIVWVNIFGIIILAIAIAVFGIPFFMIWHEQYSISIGINTAMSLQERIKNLAIAFSILIPGITAHELIHGIVYAIFAKNKWKSVKFGIMPAKKLFTPYCCCKERLKINHYRIAAIMPLIILGIIPATISIVLGNYFLLLWGIIFTVGGCGDILIFIKTLKEKKGSWILDHPTEAGYYVYKKIH